MPYFSYNLKRNYTYVCYIKFYDILKVKNALVSLYTPFRLSCVHDIPLHTSLDIQRDSKRWTQLMTNMM